MEFKSVRCMWLNKFVSIMEFTLSKNWIEKIVYVLIRCWRKKLFEFDFVKWTIGKSENDWFWLHLAVPLVSVVWNYSLVFEFLSHLKCCTCCTAERSTRVRTHSALKCTCLFTIVIFSKLKRLVVEKNTTYGWLTLIRKTARILIRSVSRWFGNNK